MKIAAYVRVSTLNQAQTQTIGQQIDRILSHCQQQGFDIQAQDIFEDNGYSGAHFKRPGLEHLRDAVASARFDRILITEPDRLARNFVHQALLMDELQSRGCVVEFLDRPISEDPHDQLLLQIRGAVAEYERTLIAERMRRGRLAKIQAGTLLPFTRAPYGYRLDPDHPRHPGRLSRDEAEAAVVKELFALYLKDDTTLRELARELHIRGINSPTGKKWWHLGSLRGILTNPLYKGEIYAGRTRSQPSKSRLSALRPVGKAGLSVRQVPGEDWILVARLEAIISEEVFEQVQEKLRHNKRFARRNNSVHPYLLRCLVSCGHCHLACTGRGGSSSYGYYVCNGKNSPIESRRSEVCRARMISARELDELVWNDLVEVLKAPELITTAMGRARSGEWMPQQMQSRRRQLRRGQTSLKNQIERLTRAYLSGVIELEEYQRRRREMQEQAESLAGQEREIERESMGQGQLCEYVKGIEEFAQRVRESLLKATFEQKRELVELLIDRVIVTDEEVEIRYVIPTSPAGEKMRFCHLRSDYCNPL